MEGANFCAAIFLRCQFKIADFYAVSAFNARFIECHFDAIDFRGANLDAVFFVDCQLIRCDFSKDNLGVDTDLSETTFIDSPHI